MTKTIEGNADKDGAEGGHGAIWETIKIMDFLFLKFKTAAAETEFEEESHFKAGIDCGWKKLEDYYLRTDETPVYRAALALHPSYGYDYFERHWKRAMNKPTWFREMKDAVSEFFDEYRVEHELNVEEDEAEVDSDQEDIPAANEYSAFGKRSLASTRSKSRKRGRVLSELDKFQTRTVFDEDLDVKDPLEWWHRRGKEYPILYKMAVDLFSIPGMSSECERIFSSAKKVITDERTRLSPETVEMDQCLKHWILRGLFD